MLLVTQHNLIFLITFQLPLFCFSLTKILNLLQFCYNKGFFVSATTKDFLFCGLKVVLSLIAPVIKYFFFFFNWYFLLSVNKYFNYFNDSS